LRRALGHGFDGGALLDVAHVGSTAVPGFVAKPTLDLIARVHPWPLAPAAEGGLVALGFVAHGERDIPGRAYYTRGGHALHLHVVGLESDHWSRHVALRDFLRGDDAARRRYAGAKAAAIASARAEPEPRRARAAYQDAKSATVTELERAALAWQVGRVGFRPMLEVAAGLAAAPERWAFAGGWALDARALAPARVHDDVDVVTDVRDAGALLDALSAAGFEVAWVLPSASGPAAYRRRCAEPVHPGGHQAHARRGELWVDVLLEPWSDDAWRYRRAPEVALPLARAITSQHVDGVPLPLLAPEAVLLFKATTGGRATPRPKDDADLARALPTMTTEGVRWLREAMAATAPGHAWLSAGGPLEAAALRR
jgi:GrpB-like predicted nucleotidyltransferase (UPF0157 family)